MKKKFLKVTIAVMLLVLVYANIVNALSFTVSMTPSSSNVDPSNEFTISIKVSNLDVGENGINTISGILDYDETVFETISDSSFDGINAWTHTYNSDTKKITLIKNTFVKTEEQVLQITFKTRSELTDGTVGQIKLTEIVASNSESEITASDISTSITIGQEVNTNTGNTSNNAGNLLIVPTNNTVRNKPVNNIISPVVNKTNTSEDDMPHTGVEDTVIYFLVAAVILAMVFYIKFEKVNKEMKK